MSGPARRSRRDGVCAARRGSTGLGRRSAIDVSADLIRRTIRKLTSEITAISRNRHQAIADA